MKSLADIIEFLEKKFMSLTDQQKPLTASMLGFQDRSFGYLQSLLGMSGKIREYEAALRDASGETKQLTDRVLKSFNAQMLILGNNIKDVARRVGEFFAPMILKVNHMIRESVAAWNSLNTEVQSTIIAVSHPSRVRGLKLASAYWLTQDIKSHPSRVRGLKHGDVQAIDIIVTVAPFTGAWIETRHFKWVSRLHN